MRQGKPLFKLDESAANRIIESSYDGVFILDQTFHVIYGNRSFCQSSGYSSKEILTMQASDFFPDTGIDQFKEKISSLDDENSDGRVEISLEYRKKNGTHYAAQIQILPFHDIKPFGYICIARDLTKSLHAEQALQRENERFRELVMTSPAVMLVVDGDMNIKLMNSAFFTLFGYSLEDVWDIESWWSKACPDERYRQKVQSIWADHIADSKRKKTSSIEPIMVDITCADESVKKVEVQMGSISDYSLVVFNDLSERISMDNRDRRSAAVIEHINQGVMITDLDVSIVAVNSSFTTITGYGEEEVLGQKPSILSSGRHDKFFYQHLWERLQEDGFWQGEVWNRRKSGEVYVESLTITPVYDENGLKINYVGLFTDITQAKLSENELHHLAHHDALTDLPNRLLFNTHLKQAVARASRLNNRVGVLFLDLDRFKNVNDSFGHQAGDELLIQVAKRLRQTLRDEDVLARLGGDEFVILVEGVDDEERLGAFTQRLIDSLTSPFTLRGQEVFIGTSVGISIFPGDGKQADILMRNADSAMYQAKERGRNNYQFYTKKLTEAAFERLMMEMELRKALAADEFSVVYQPQVDMKEGRFIGCEALIRWTHPKMGQISPDKFIPIAEEAGLIAPIGDWVMHRACRDAKSWIDEGLIDRISVNVSGYQVQQGTLLNTVNGALLASGLKAEQLELEITETFIMEHAEEAIKMLEEIRKLGVYIAIDDFGTGYSSLSYLKKLPVHTLKIDREFVSYAAEDTDDAAIIRAIVALAKTLGLEVLAEGVENREQQNFLVKESCYKAQGYFYSRPLSLSECNSLLRRSSIMPEQTEHPKLSQM